MRAAAAVLLAAGSAASNEWTFRGVRHTGELTTNTPTLCDSSVQQYAGYYNIDSGAKQYFYWAFAARSPAADGNTPTLLWMTGGPGCSSSTALFGENGPCKPNQAGTDTINNTYSWNNYANIIYIDQPAGVGFSKGKMDDHDETGVANDMYQFLQAFFKDHPDWNTRFFTFGESYGGHYVPATAHRVWKGAKDGEGIKINLAGVAVGNGLTDPEIQYKYYGEMAYNWSITVQGKPTVSASTYQKMQAAVPACINLIQECNKNGDQNTCQEAQGQCNNAEIGPYQETGLNPYDIREPCKVPPLCYDFSNIDTYLNSKTVQAALGVSGKWESCNYQVNSQFSGDWMLNYQTMLPDMLEDNIPVLIYAGDVDFICNWIGNKAWTLALPWAGKDKFNNAADEAWTLNGKEAGKVRTAQGFTFLQIHAAGHMVPRDKPEESLTMVQTFINGKPW